LDARVWPHWEHTRDQEAGQEKNGSEVDDVAHGLAEEKWWRLLKMAEDANSVAMVHSASDAEDV
jgi:hypothetical protein